MNLTGAELIHRFLQRTAGVAVCVARDAAAQAGAWTRIDAARTAGEALVCILGLPPRAEIAGLRAPCAGASPPKATYHVGAAAELINVLPEAFALAQSGRAGPVVLEIPADVESELLEGAFVPAPHTGALA
jgi:acetolactate synthase-1/2/3 large subunit